MNFSFLFEDIAPMTHGVSFEEGMQQFHGFACPRSYLEAYAQTYNTCMTPELTSWVAGRLAPAVQMGGPAADAYGRRLAVLLAYARLSIPLAACLPRGSKYPIFEDSGSIWLQKMYVE